VSEISIIIITVVIVIALLYFSRKSEQNVSKSTQVESTDILNILPGTQAISGVVDTSEEVSVDEKRAFKWAVILSVWKLMPPPPLIKIWFESIDKGEIGIYLNTKGEFLLLKLSNGKDGT